MNLRPTAHSPTLAMHDLSSLRAQKGLDIIKLGFGQSPFPPPASIIKALQQHADKHFYSPVSGIPELREVVAAHHKKHNNIDCYADNILISAGSKALLYATMASFQKAAIIIPIPSWVSYAPQAQLLGHMTVPLYRSPTKRWRIDSNDLEKAAAQCPDGVQKIMILNYPGNPDGIAYTAEELATIAKTAKENDILILSDEIYGRLHFENNHISIATFYPEGTIVTSGLSKWCGAGGWRLGTAIIPDELEAVKNTMTGILSEIVSGAPTPVQLAAIEAYQDTPDILDSIRKRQQILKTLGHFCYKTLTQAGISSTKPEGGFYCLVDFMPMQDKFQRHNIHTADQLCTKLLEDTGVALLSGTAFGLEESYLSARLAFVDFDGQAALNAAEHENINNNFIQKNCHKTCDGITRITTWAGQL